ncbi:hypothetical protein PAPYR_7671 [Paratrimastix pyriformis]|uniref:CAAX prenyl protease 2/Lysostaphin resistance protein A-like domain-containing protein n=1 Tax=Paratrimastix pyriformis TaxID=342808 RepID=A0ABQ8UFP5_9EUKA|nr:hypothetical protein PAPYR_7671 [Paratrimastix pyriformis]
MGFLELFLKVQAVAGATFGIFEILLLAEVLFQRALFRFKADPFSSDSAEKHSWRTKLLQTLRTNFTVTFSLWCCLMASCLRRSFSDASSFDIPQMWWHSLASVGGLTCCLLINRFIGRNTLTELGIPATTWRWLVPNCLAWARRIVLMLLVALGTHTLMPFMVFVSGCFGGFQPADYRGHPFWEIFYFFFVQQVCFAINAVDEETNWRGLHNAVFTKGRHSRPVMYFASGWVYAMVHSLNTELTSFGLYSLMIFNLVCEGACWMYLYRMTGDLVGNWVLHDFDDLVCSAPPIPRQYPPPFPRPAPEVLLTFTGILFLPPASARSCPSALAGYRLPLGQIMPYVLTCPEQVLVSGGDFGDGASLLYLVQNLYTIGLLVLIDWCFAWRKKRAVAPRAIGYRIIDHNSSVNSEAMAA